MHIILIIDVICLFGYLDHTCQKTLVSDSSPFPPKAAEGSLGNGSEHSFVVQHGLFFSLANVFLLLFFLLKKEIEITHSPGWTLDTSPFRMMK